MIPEVAWEQLGQHCQKSGEFPSRNTVEWHLYGVQTVELAMSWALYSKRATPPR